MRRWTGFLASVGEMLALTNPQSHFSRPVRVLFLNPPSLAGEVWMKEVGRCGRKAIAGEIWPQTGLAYLAAMVEREGQEARILDAMAEPLSLGALREKVREWLPQLIIANSATPTLRNDAQVLAELSRDTAALLGLSGPHVSALPVETLGETCADFGIINEADETVAELARAAHSVQGERDGLLGILPTIRGIAWKEGNNPDGTPESIRVNAPRPLVEDLDVLPLPARHLLPNEAYRMPFFGDHQFATIIPTRGCPWPCTFCRAGKVWGRRIRTRSVESVLREIESLQQDHGIGHLVFMTDSLTLDRGWAFRLFDALARLEQRVEWIGNSRVDAVDLDLLQRMKRAGCRQVAYGVESGSQRILDRCRKGISLEQSENAIRLTREAGLQSMAYFVLGLPGETRETIEESIRFARRINPDYVNFHVATPFPGTEFYEEAQREGWLISSDWNDFEEEGSAVVALGELSPQDLLDAQRRAMRSFYLRPSRLLGELGRLRSWPEFRAKARAGLKMIATLAGK